MNCQETCFYYLKNPKTELEVRTYLKKKRFNDNDIEDAIYKAKEYGYIDDKSYCDDYIHDHVKFNRWGPIKIKFKLQEKGIKFISEDYILKNYRDEILNNIRDIIDYKYSNQDLESYEEMAKVYRYFYQKGYVRELVDEAIYE